MDSDPHDQLLDILSEMDIPMEVLILIPDLPLHIVEGMLDILNNPDEYMSDVSEDEVENEQEFPWIKIFNKV